MEYKFLKYSLEAVLRLLPLTVPKYTMLLMMRSLLNFRMRLKLVSKDDSVRVVVLTGEGKAFCSGQDLKSSVLRKNRSFMDSLHKRYNPIIRAMRNLPKPIVCRLNGVAAGAGCSIALACDIIVAAEEATLIEVFVNIGLVPDSGSSYFLPRLVGNVKAFEFCAMGNKVKATDALQMGLVNKVVPMESLDEAVNVYTTYFAAAPTKAIGLIKKMLQKSATSSLDEMLDYEAYCQEIAGGTEDYKEGVAAFAEKRKPKFLGK